MHGQTFLERPVEVPEEPYSHQSSQNRPHNQCKGIGQEKQKFALFDGSKELECYGDGRIETALAESEAEWGVCYVRAANSMMERSI